MTARTRTLHVEKHFTSGNFVRDVVIGMSDGLTVPFALAAGLSGAVSNTKLITIGGLAEIAAGSIAMGLGGYLAARGDAEHYDQERAREYREIKEIPEEEVAEVKRVFENYGLPPQESLRVAEALSKHPDAWVDFQARSNQRRDDRGGVHLGRVHSSFTVRGPVECLSRPHLFGSYHLVCARNFRIRQGPIHWRESSAQRDPDHADRRNCGCCGVRAGKADRLTAWPKCAVDALLGTSETYRSCASTLHGPIR